jgi:hypothetical protein
VEGTGSSGPVMIDVSALGVSLLPGDTFTLSRSGNNLALNYIASAIPEPALLLGLAVVALAVRRRK